MSQDLNQFSRVTHTRERPARRLKGGVRPLGSRVQVFVFFEKIFGPQLLHDFLYHFLSKNFCLSRLVCFFSFFDFLFLFLVFLFF